MRFLETIKVIDGIAQYLPYHQARVARTLGSKAFALEAVLQDAPTQGIYRARILYDGHRQQITYHPYVQQIPKSFALVYDDAIDYTFKYADRTALEKLFDQRGLAETVLIIKNGAISDTPIANVAFLKEGRWFTPDSPLLEGTTRARLIASGLLHVSPIRVADITAFEGFAVMNAMTGFVRIEDGIMAIKSMK